MLKVFSIRLKRFKLQFHHVFSHKPFLCNCVTNTKPIVCTVKFNKTSNKSFYARKVLNKYKHLIKNRLSLFVVSSND